MITDLMQEKGLDHQLNFDELPSLSSLVDETFEDAESKDCDSVTLKDGRLNAPFLLRNARILLAAKDFQLAKAIFQKLIESGEALGAAYAGLGVCFEHERNIDASIQSYREAIIYEPSFTSLIALADLYARKTEFKSSIKTLLRANHLPKMKKSESFRIHHTLGNCYLRMEQFDHAETHFKKAFDLKADDELLHISLGCFALMKNNLTQANAHFLEASRINEGNAKAFTGTGYVKFLMRKYTDSIDYFSRALEIDITESSALFYLIRAAYETKNFETAIKLTEKYIRNNPINSSILYSLAGMYCHIGRKELAQATCQQILELNPEHKAANRLLQICTN